MSWQKSLTIQSKEKRIKNFDEVALGFSKGNAQEEARRCPQCNDPKCKISCPLKIDIPAFIRLLREGNNSGARNKICEENVLPGVCGRLCSAPCEEACILSEENASIRIRALERYAADHGQTRFAHVNNNDRSVKKVAVVGSGPAGLTAAGYLSREGFQVTIFELLPEAGGILCSGIPAFRFPRNVRKREINVIENLGVTIIDNEYIGRTITIDELFSQNYSAVLLAVGSGGAKFIEIPGSYFGGVYYGEEVLLRLNFDGPKNFQKKVPLEIRDTVAVIGSGNMALDCARTCVRLGRKVSLVFEGTEEELAVYCEDYKAAKDEGINFVGVTRALEILADQTNFVCGLKCMNMDFADPDSSGTWRLIPVPDSGFVLDADTVILAAGHKTNQDVLTMVPDLKLNSNGTVWLDKKNRMTSCLGVFAAGDVILGTDTLVEGMASGKEVAQFIAQYLKNN